MKMHKIAIAIVTLAMITSAASADAIWLQVAPGDTPTPGGTIEIQMVADAPIVGWRLRAARAPSGCSAAGEDDWQQHSNVGGNQWKPDYVDNYDHTDGYTYLFWDCSWREHSTYGNPPITPGEVILAFDLTIHDTWDGVTPFTLDLLNHGEFYYYDDGANDYDDVSGNNEGVFGSWANPAYAPIADLTIVPEPATLGLLAAGAVGLLTRRKSRNA